MKLRVKKGVFAGEVAEPTRQMEGVGWVLPVSNGKEYIFFPEDVEIVEESPHSLTDKALVFGTSDAGSIPAEGTNSAGEDAETSPLDGVQRSGPEADETENALRTEAHDTAISGSPW